MSFFDPSTETLPREQLQALQLAKLRDMLGQIYGRNRFYTAKLMRSGVSPEDLRSRDDLSRLPLTTKAELVQAQAEDPPFGTNVTFPETSYARFHQTSGTTGAPLRVLDTEESWDWWGKCWAHVFCGAGLTSADRLFVPFSFGPFSGFWAAVEGARKIGAMMIPGGGRDTLQRLHVMRELRATAMCCTPTYALRMAEVAREHRFNLRDIPMRVTVHAGEPGASIPSTRARIEAAWGVQCFDHAGASEVGAHSFGCESRPGEMHVIESEFVVEILRPGRTDPAQVGETGELVLTNLGRIGFPVIRYRTGDLVKLNPAPCDCGRSFARLEGGILGRVDDMVVIRGVNVFPSALENLLRRFDAIDEYQAMVSRRGELTELGVALELANGADSPAVQAAVEQEISLALGLRPVITLAERGSLPRFELKAKRFRIEP